MDNSKEHLVEGYIVHSIAVFDCKICGYRRMKNTKTGVTKVTKQGNPNVIHTGFVIDSTVSSKPKLSNN